MVRIYRATLVVSGAVLAVLAAGFLAQAGWATDLWIWPDASRLSNIFVASILAAIAAPLVWIGVTGKIRAGTAGGLNLLVMFSGIAGFLAWRSAQTDGSRLGRFAVLFAIGAIVMAGGYLFSRRFPTDDARPTPAPVRWSFAAFSVVLVAVGAGLVFGAPHIFPWPLPEATSAVYGWVFWGAAVYFAHGFAFPVWDNAAGQLLGFLAYDIVLIGPYLAHLDDVVAQHRPSLLVYLVVILYSAGLALFYLVANPTTRLMNPLRPAGLSRPVEASSPRP